MKRTIPFIMAGLLILSLAGCVKVQPAMASAVPSAAATPPQTTTVPTPSTEATPIPTETETSIITDGPIPDLLGTQWYKDKYLGNNQIVECDNSRVCLNIIDNTSLETEWGEHYLSFADADGRNPIITKIGHAYNFSYIDGWLYFTQLSNGFGRISKIKPDGTDKKEIYSVKETNKNGIITDMYIYNNRIFIYEDWYFQDDFCHGMLKSMDMKGRNIREIKKINKLVGFSDGSFVYTIMNDQNGENLMKYDINTGLHSKLSENIHEGRAMLRENTLYHTLTIDDKHEALYAMDITTGIDKLIIEPSRGTIHGMDFFDRWLLINSNNQLLGYDLATGKIYLLADITVEDALIMTTPKHSYLSDGGLGYMYPIIFENGSVTIGSCINKMY